MYLAQQLHCYLGCPHPILEGLDLSPFLFPMPQIFESLPPTWKTWIEFTTPGSHLAQPQLWAFRE